MGITPWNDRQNPEFTFVFPGEEVFLGQEGPSRLDVGWVFAILAGLTLAQAAWSAACLGDSLKYRHFKEEYGVFNAATRQTIQLPCDTMVVETGKLVTVYPNTLLHFGEKASEASIIVVRGQLLAEGDSARPILFVGNEGKAKWGGFRVDTLGSLGFRDVEIRYAVTAITFIGKNSLLERIHFFGSYGLILPGGRSHALNPHGDFYPQFDILNPPWVHAQNRALSPSPSREQQEPPPKMQWKATLVIAAVAAGALVGSAVSYWMLR